MRRFVMLEIERYLSADLTRWVPVNGKPGDDLYLHPSHIIECADSGPVYTDDFNEGDALLTGDLNPVVQTTRHKEWYRFICFPPPEREEENSPRNAVDGYEEPVDPAEWCGGALGGVL